MAKKKSSPAARVNPLLVSFRLPDEAIAAELAAQAQAAGKSSPSLFARDLVIGALIRPDALAEQLSKLSAEMETIDRTLKQVRLLREDLASSVNILLAAAGQLTAEQAQDWVKENLLKHR